MLTVAEDLRRHMIRIENEIYHLRHSGDPDGRLRWLNVYIKVLRIRHEWAQARETKTQTA